MSNELTLEERIRITKAKYEADPNYKPGPPKVEVVAVDIKNLKEPPKGVSKSVSALFAEVNNQKELRLLKRTIENKLKSPENVRIPKEITISNIKNLPHIIRSKVEEGKARAEFLLECIDWENKNPDPEDIHFWSGKALEVLSAWIGVCEKDKTEIKKLYELCQVLFQSKMISSDDKLNIASAFYLSNLIEYCYDLYYIILLSPYTRVEARAECCKFLYYSSDEKYIPAIEKHLTDIILSDADDDLRYETIANYVTTTGISTKFLSNVLNVNEINQPLLVRLFNKFIDTKCDYFYIIMACEFLLEQETDKTLYPKVCEKLISICTNKSETERIRADAADVLLKHNIEPYSSQAQEVIHEIGEAGQNEMEKNIFTNKENVHYLNDTFMSYLVNLHKKHVGKMQKMDRICEEIENIIIDLSEDSIFKIRQSLDRITLEPSLHTERKISTTDIFRLIWTVIQNHKQKEDLQKRFFEELEDMANTCSSGHAKRLINVMVGYDDSLEGCIDIKDQFIANIKARLMATIKYKENADDLLESMIDKGNGKTLFNDHIKSVVSSVEKELRNEFIVEGWLSEKIFEKLFNSTIQKILCV